MVERIMVRPPTARIGPITAEERKAIMDKSPVKGKYDTTIDSESAYEVLQKRVAGAASGEGGLGGGGIFGQIGGAVADLGKSMGGSIGGSVGRALVRGAPGGLLRR
jgi:hypothetical protein